MSRAAVDREKIVKPQMTGLSLTPGLSIFPTTSVKLSMLDRDLQGVKLDRSFVRCAKAIEI